MRPIDTIKNKIDSDFTKYHGTTLCRIISDQDIRNIRGVGLCALVTPVNKNDSTDNLTVGEEYTFSVMIVNRPNKYMESNISQKYYVLVLNVVPDRGASGVGFLISKTMLTDPEVFRNSLDVTSRLKDSAGRGLETMTKENIVKD